EDRPPSAAVVRQQILAWAGGDEPAARPAADPDTAEVIADLEAQGTVESGWDWVPPASLAGAGRPWTLGGVPPWLPLALAIGLGVVAAVLLLLAWWASR